jgi:hypothetical protein
MAGTASLSSSEWLGARSPLYRAKFGSWGFGLMILRAALVIGALVVGAPALASPVMLECVTDYPADIRGRTYQIIFDDSTHTVTRDDSKPVKARITATLINWNESGQLGNYAWQIDRLTGAWRLQPPGEASIGGKCTAPPPRKF